MKKRKDSFWGIHCDYHARPWMKAPGSTLCEEDIRKVCRELRPDFWQIDCKGHFGWASYPSQFSNAMPQFACDTLAMWRKVTREEGVALYLHYSGLWDEKYCSEHPEEGIMHADGTYDTTRLFPGSRYVDELMIPQMCELAEKYGVDGFWIDGDNWVMQMDYRPETLKEFESETGICLNGQKPAKPSDPYYQEYRDFNRELFRRYVRHYVDTLHAKFPNLQITSNWMFSDLMPEEVSVGLDYISGDISPFNSVNAARYAARFMPQQNMTWDIMGMGQRYNGDGKIDLLATHATQVMQQAAAVISLGGAFEAGLSQLFDGSPRMMSLLNLKPVADFMKAREPFCFKGKPVPQAAMLVSTYDRHHEKSGVFDRGLDNSEAKRGFCALLCNTGHSLENIAEHTLVKRADEFKMIAIPELVEGLAPETIQLLLRYVENGGSLLLNGVNTCRIFAAAGAPFEAVELDDPVPTERFLGQRNDARDQRFFTVDECSCGGVLYPIQLIAKGDVNVVATTFYDEKSVRKPFAIIVPYGKGKIAAIGADLGKPYDQASQYQHRRLMEKLTKDLYTPLVRVEKALGFVDIVCLQKDGRLMLQLMNGNGNHQSIACDTEDFIPPALDIQLSISAAKPPKKLLLQPEGTELPFTHRDKRAYVELDRLEMHQIIEVHEE